MKIFGVILMALVSAVSWNYYERYKVRSYMASDAYIRERIVHLKTEKGSCTGVRVKLGDRIVILSAKHCEALLIDNKASAVEENGKEGIAVLLKIDPMSDLLILSTEETTYLPIAGDTHSREKVHTLTHGKRHVTYRTDGELLEEESVTMPVFEVLDKKDEDKCSEAGGRLELSQFFSVVCMISQNIVWSTARIVPGSSGGPVLNEKGELVGIVSLMDGAGFSGFVRLKDIHEFLK